MRAIIEHVNQMYFNSKEMLSWVPADCGIVGNKAADGWNKIRCPRETIS